MVVVILSVVILGLSVILVKNILDMTKIVKIEKVAPSYFEANVYPKEGKIGTSFKVSFSVYNKSGIEFVTANILKDNQAVSAANLYDDGSHGDEKADDGIFSNVWNSENSKEGSYIISFGVNENRYPNATSFQVYKGNCINLVNSGPSDDRINIVFLASNYKSMEKFRNDVIKHIDLNSRNNGLFSFEPFKSDKGKFNVYYVNETVNLGCSLNCEGIQSMICCNDDKVVEAASQCPADQIIVLNDKPEFCGTATFYAKVCSYGISPIVMVHEFGHSFGGLGDEYNYEEVYPSYAKAISLSELNFPNCAKPGCDKWENISSECWKGCTTSAFYRPTKSNCIMYTYVPQFCPVCQNQFKELMYGYGQSASPEVLSRAAAPLGKSYFMNIDYNEGILKLNNIYSAPGSYKSPNRNIDIQKYNGKLLAFDGKTLESFSFEIPRLIWPPMEAGNGTQYSPIVKDKFNYTLSVPYSTEGKIFEVYDRNNRKVMALDVGYLADTCGNKKCEPQENYLECPSDCALSIPDKLCLSNNDGTCDPDCRGKDPDCRNVLYIAKNNLAIILSIIALIMIIILVSLASKEK